MFLIIFCCNPQCKWGAEILTCPAVMDQSYPNSDIQYSQSHIWTISPGSRGNQPPPTVREEFPFYINNNKILKVTIYDNKASGFLHVRDPHKITTHPCLQQIPVALLTAALVYALEYFFSCVNYLIIHQDNLCYSFGSLQGLLSGVIFSEKLLDYSMTYMHKKKLPMEYIWSLLIKKSIILLIFALFFFFSNVIMGYYWTSKLVCNRKSPPSSPAHEMALEKKNLCHCLVRNS